MFNEESLDDFLVESVNESVERRSLKTSEEIKSYLVDVLKSNIISDKVFTNYDLSGEKHYGLKPITFQMFDAKSNPGKLKQLGDHCLFLVGYFYDFLLDKGKGQVDFHKQVGSSAYGNFGSAIYDDSGIIKNMFVDLANDFESYSEVIGDLHLHSLDEKNILGLYDKFIVTKDKRYSSMLYSKGIIVN